MEIAEFFSRFSLHDSVVQQIHLDSQNGTLVFLVELCNYDQPHFLPGDPDMVTRWLLFSGVSEVTSTMPLDKIGWGRDVDGEFVDFVQEAEGGLKAVIKIDHYHTKVREVIALRFRSAAVEWRDLTEDQLSQLEQGRLPSPSSP